MSRDYVTKEISQIVKDTSLEYPLNMAMASAWILGNLKALNLKILDVSTQSSLADYFIIGSATNPVQAAAMAEEITYQLKQHGMQTKSVEGKNGEDWLLVDLGDILVHIFQDNSREIYNLDAVWDKAEIIDIPESYYFSTPENETEVEDSKDYF